MEIKTSTQIRLHTGIPIPNMRDFDNKKWVALSQEVKEAISLYLHLKNHTEVKNSVEYSGMPICKICNKSAYQIMREEFDTFIKTKGEFMKNIQDKIKLSQNSEDKESNAFDMGYKEGRDTIQKEVEELRIKITEMSKEYSGIAERLWDIAHRKIPRG